MNDILGSIFQDLDPENAAKDGKPLSAVLGERLDRATAEIEGEATGDPLAVARMQMTLGSSQLGLGYPDRAIVLFTKARATFAAELGPDHPDTLMSMNNLAISYTTPARTTGRCKLCEEILALQKAKLGPDHPDTLKSMNNLANSYHRRRPERPGAEAPRGDTGVAEGEARPRPPRHAREHGQPRQQLSARRPERPGD